MMIFIPSVPEQSINYTLFLQEASLASGVAYIELDANDVILKRPSFDGVGRIRSDLPVGA